jgi:methionyl-tRNA formyltransferase
MTSLIFFGSDQYSAIVLRELLATNYQILSVVTDQHNDPSPVEKLAKTHNLKVAYYPTNTDEMSKFISHLESISSLLESNTFPLGLCASFDHLIPAEIIVKFAGNLYNLHPSLLPQYRNVSPVQYAIALGDQTTGITLFRITNGIDNGEIISQVSEPILETDTTPTLTSHLFELGAELFIATLKSNFSPPSTIYHLPTTNLVFTRRLTRDSGFIEWPVLSKLLKNEAITSSDTKNELLNLRLQKESISHSNLESRIYLLDLMRALNPWPGVWSLVPTRKSDLRISIPYQLPTTNFQILISGKPLAISLSDFTKYYL